MRKLGLARADSAPDSKWRVRVFLDVLSLRITRHLVQTRPRSSHNGMGGSFPCEGHTART